MHIELHSAGRRYNTRWIFRNLNYKFKQGEIYAITGANGSGKSTLLQCIASILTFSEGKVHYNVDNQTIKPEEHYRNVTIATPYIDPFSFLKLDEILDAHFRLNPRIDSISNSDILTGVGLKGKSKIHFNECSSGMKQRIRLALAFYSDLPFLFLDEPCSNLDEEGEELYAGLLSKNSPERLVIIASNRPQEYKLAKEELNVEHYQKG